MSKRAIIEYENKRPVDEKQRRHASAKRFLIVWMSCLGVLVLLTLLLLLAGTLHPSRRDHLGQ